MSVFDTAGLMTDNNGASPFGVTPGRFHELGYRWIVAQAQNGATAKPVNLDAYKQAGFQVGVWGVTYRPEDFTRDGVTLALSANQMHADLLIMDAEECLKGADPRPLIQACAAFPGPKALSTLGAASGQNVYPIDWRAFVDAGWHVLAQAYTAWSTDYRPELCRAHWVDRAGLPLERFHLTIDSSPEFRAAAFGGLGRAQTAAEILTDLRETRIVSPDVSVFMAEYGDDHFYQTISEVTMQQAPVPPHDAATTKQAVYELVDAQVARWRTAGLTDAQIQAQRITVAEQLLKTTDAQWAAARPTIAGALS